jgi:hypothetical protein
MSSSNAAATYSHLVWWLQQSLQLAAAAAASAWQAQWPGSGRSIAAAVVSVLAHEAAGVDERFAKQLQPLPKQLQQQCVQQQ